MVCLIPLGECGGLGSKILSSKIGELAEWFVSSLKGECSSLCTKYWRVGRVVECGGLENR